MVSSVKAAAAGKVAAVKKEEALPLCMVGSR